MRRVLLGNLGWHPAVAAWQQVAPMAPEPESLEVLDHRSRSGVYRLVGAGPDGTTIIARRSALARALFTRAVYQKILPRLRVKAPRYQALKVENARVAWLFLEESLA